MNVRSRNQWLDLAFDKKPPPQKKHPCLFFKGEKLNVSAECAPVLVSSVLILAPPLQSRAQPLSGAAT